MPSYASTVTVAEALPDVRAAFIRRTYAHLAGAVLLFIGLEIALFQTSLPLTMTTFMTGSRFGWLGILGAFVACGWLARSMAANVSSVPAQYAGLAFYVVAEAVIFVPIITMAVVMTEDASILRNAAVLTGALFLGLTAIVFITRKDFSFLGSILALGGFVAIGLIVCAAIFGFSLGLFFSVAMVALAGAAILYDTSKIMHYYPVDRHVSAALQLFASVALLFWYILRIMMRRR